MDKIRIRDKNFKLYIPEEKIEQAVSRMAKEIKTDIEGKKDVQFVCILSGSFMFTAELMAELDGPYKISFARYSSYSGTSSTGMLKEIMPIEGDLVGKTLILIEDIVDTGFTMHNLIHQLKHRGAAEVKLATMLFKPESLKCDLRPDYVGIEISPAFIVGHGLDYDGEGRTYRDIYVVDEE